MRWWQWIGPWPLRPVPVGLIAGLFALATTSFTLTTQTAPRFLASGIAVGVVSGGMLWIAQRIAPTAVTRRVGFLLVVAMASLAANAVRFLTGTNLDFPNFTGVSNFVFTWARSVIFLIVILAILGASQRRLQAQVDRADDALAALSQQAEALLTADEEVRRQVSLLLHDRVQAGLIAACLRLRRSLGPIPDRDAEVARVVDQLEELRTLDVRRAVHALSPNLSEVDLVSALEELSETYAPAMRVTCTQSHDVDVPEDLRLGVYRVVEQCLLNSAMHGDAEHCTIDIAYAGTDIIVTVTDDGVGMSSDATSGFGTTLIDTWCRVLGAQWSRRPGAQGTVVELRIPEEP
jgi:signal transduction histidine kinase